MTNKDRCFQTKNEVMLTIVANGYHDELATLETHHAIFQQIGDADGCASYQKIIVEVSFMIKQIEQLIAKEQDKHTSIHTRVLIENDSPLPNEEHLATSVAYRF